MLLISLVNVSWLTARFVLTGTLSLLAMVRMSVRALEDRVAVFSAIELLLMGSSMSVGRLSSLRAEAGTAEVVAFIMMPVVVQLEILWHRTSSSVMLGGGRGAGGLLPDCRLSITVVVFMSVMTVIIVMTVWMWKLAIECCGLVWLSLFGIGFVR